MRVSFFLVRVLVLDLDPPKQLTDELGKNIINAPIKMFYEKEHDRERVESIAPVSFTFLPYKKFPFFFKKNPSHHIIFHHSEKKCI